MGDSLKKVVIAGSASLEEQNLAWVKYWNAKAGYTVTDFPQPIPPDRFLEEYPNVFQHFFASLKGADVLFIVNEEKKGIPGYIGAEVFGEMVFAVARNVTETKQIEIILARTPSDSIQAHEEIQLWLKLGWIKVLS